MTDQHRVMDNPIQLTATRASPTKIAVTGNGAANLPAKSGQHRFNFQLTDNTGTAVRFKPVADGMVDAKDDCTDCPPPPGMSSTQIIAITRTSDTMAGFTDKNDNTHPDMPVAYALNFECNDPAVTEPIQFDPIIINGGA